MPDFGANRLSMKDECQTGPDQAFQVAVYITGNRRRINVMKILFNYNNLRKIQQTI